MIGKLSIKIEKGITEQRIVEHCLMLYNSGYEFIHVLGFYAFGKGWKIDKLFYYVNLIKKENQK